MSNADMRPAEVRKHCTLDETSQALMKSAMSQLQLSARAYHRVLKLARTIADLAGSEVIQSVHLAEALQYRDGVAVDTSNAAELEAFNAFKSAHQELAPASREVLRAWVASRNGKK